MRSGWIRYERIAGSMRCHRHGVKQQVFCEGDPEKLSCLRNRRFGGFLTARAEAGTYRTVKYTARSRLTNRTSPLCLLPPWAKGGRRAGPSARSRCPSTSILHLPAAQGQTQTPQWPAVQAGHFCVPTEPTAGISKDVNPVGGGNVLRSGWEGIRLIRKLHKARRSKTPHSVSAKEQKKDPLRMNVTF